MQFLFEPLDDFLAEVGTFGQLLFNLFVDLNLALVGLDLRFHLVVLEYENLSLFRLMLQLCRELVVLQDRQMRSRLQLLVVHSQQIRLRFFYVEQHFFAQLFGLFDAVELFLIDLFQTQLVLGLKFLLKKLELGLQL